ncbi:MAG: DNA-binding protein [Candidatus Acidulodesulfobacterium ferriphilum]|uniref:DNA-binding protein n=2 Tax=Candidatus Acidulodesulfobacterium TaxID=2597222 RepID=A0A519B9L6_9DELT|nr:MAG: DNA-binding protein [Candidatus Acidulodesulfobacterium ferriphilum]RZV39019.1 MAG: DNA-binding protein [Candidatus Acidulodesulfobacterium acidiphilum]
MDKDILIINEAAAFLRVSATTLRRYIASRQITFYKLQGKSYLEKPI